MANKTLQYKTPKDLYDTIEICLPVLIDEAYPPKHHLRGKINLNAGGRTYAPQRALRIYIAARTHVVEFISQNPILPPLPDKESDPIFGLQSIQEWCIKAERFQKSNNNASGGKVGVENLPPKYKYLCSLAKGSDFWYLVLSSSKNLVRLDDIKNTDTGEDFVFLKEQYDESLKVIERGIKEYDCPLAKEAQLIFLQIHTLLITPILSCIRYKGHMFPSLGVLDTEECCTYYKNSGARAIVDAFERLSIFAKDLVMISSKAQVEAKSMAAALDGTTETSGNAGADLTDTEQNNGEKLKRGKMAKKQISVDDQYLFSAIENDIKKNPQKYSSAGKWLDKYYTQDNFWEEKDKYDGSGFEQLRKILGKEEFDKCVEKIRQNSNNHIPPENPTFQMKVLLKITKPEGCEGLQKAQAELLKTDASFLSNEVTKRIILITWLLTDPDAEKANLGITKFEKWPWGVENFTFDDPYWHYRKYASDKFVEDPEKWLSMVYKSCSKLVDEANTEAAIYNAGRANANNKNKETTAEQNIAKAWTAINPTENYIKKGKVWEICFEGEKVHIPKLAGMPLIAHLLQHSPKTFSALDLEQAVKKLPVDRRETDDLSEDLKDDENGTVGLTMTTTGGTIDGRALAKADNDVLKAAIAKLEKQRDETESEETEKYLQNQIDILGKELAKKTNRFGKARPTTGDLYEKARVRVLQKTQKVREILQEDHKKLYDHFERELKVASECYYNPIPPVKWEFFNL